MANFYGFARSNYFKVKDAEAFVAWADKFGSLGVWTRDDMHAIYSDCPDSGCWPSAAWSEDEDDFIEIDLEAELAEHLADGEVAILMQCGAEKLRYLSGYATAIDNTGKSVTVSMGDIYALAESAFGVTPTAAEY